MFNESQLIQKHFISTIIIIKHNYIINAFLGIGKKSMVPFFLFYYRHILLNYFVELTQMLQAIF